MSFPLGDTVQDADAAMPSMGAAITCGIRWQYLSRR